MVAGDRKESRSKNKVEKQSTQPAKEPGEQAQASSELCKVSSAELIIGFISTNWRDLDASGREKLTCGDHGKAVEQCRARPRVVGWKVNKSC